MNSVLEFLKGKKTYILVAIYILVVLVTGDTYIDDTNILSGIDAEALKEILLAAMVATGKAAFDRFSK